MLWRCGLALVLGASAGCSQAHPPRPAAEAVLPLPVWPGPPAESRIRWTGEIHGPTDLGIRPGPLRRLWNWVSGEHVAPLVRPHGVAVDPKGRLWVADPGARAVHVFDSADAAYWRLPRRDDPPLSSPIAVTHDAAGTAYVSDSAHGVIRRFDSGGRSLASWGGGKLVRPTGIGFDSSTGLLWVVDTGAHCLLALREGGEVERIVGERGTAPGKFNFPTHIAVDAVAGRLYVTDTLNFRVQVLSAQGQPLGAISEAGDGPGALSKPKGVALDRDGHIYVADGMFDNVQIFDPEGHVLLYFGERGIGRGQFWLPAGLCIAEGHRIYVADGYNSRVQVFEYLRR